MKNDESKDTSWGSVAEWYDNYLETNTDSYQEKVITPNLLRIMGIKKGTRVLDLACGQGFFSRRYQQVGASVIASDISTELIDQAQKRSKGITFHVSPADKIGFAQDGEFEIATIVLAIQNIKNMVEVFQEANRVLAKGGRLILVMNHPTFRIPKRSNWEWDDKREVQYRRIEGYLSSATVPIVMHPGQKDSEETLSYHRSLQEFFKALNKAGFKIGRLEEWISHKKSEAGPRQKAEDLIRKEIPLFMMIEAIKD